MSGSTESRGWAGTGSSPTRVVLLRHGVTAHTLDKRFSGGLGGEDPALSEDGRAQALRSARWLGPVLPTGTHLVASPVRRARETAGILAESCALRPAELDEGFAETDFGAWEGLTFAEAADRDPAALDRWLASTAEPAGGTGESFVTVAARVRAALARVVRAHRGGTVVVVGHVTPIKVMVADALGAPLEALFRMELRPASVSIVDHHPDADAGAASPDRPSLRLFDGVPDGP